VAIKILFAGAAGGKWEDVYTYLVASPLARMHLYKLIGPTEEQAFAAWIDRRYAQDLNKGKAKYLVAGSKVQLIPFGSQCLGKHKVDSSLLLTKYKHPNYPDLEGTNIYSK
jgi:hypothetical protein